MRCRRRRRSPCWRRPTPSVPGGTARRRGSPPAVPGHRCRCPDRSSPRSEHDIAWPPSTDDSPERPERRCRPRAMARGSTHDREPRGDGVPSGPIWRPTSTPQRPRRRAVVAGGGGSIAACSWQARASPSGWCSSGSASPCRSPGTRRPSCPTRSRASRLSPTRSRCCRRSSVFVDLVTSYTGVLVIDGVEIETIDLSEIDSGDDRARPAGRHPDRHRLRARKRHTHLHAERGRADRDVRDGHSPSAGDLLAGRGGSLAGRPVQLDVQRHLTSRI